MVILSVPDAIAIKIIEIKNSIQNQTKIINCSTAHRTDPDWVYGLPEIDEQNSEIKNAKVVANPGCHATAAILSARPLINADIINTNTAIVTSITGYSGGGKQLIESYEKDPTQTPVQYSTGIKHKHLAEIKKFGGIYSTIFQPEVVNNYNGLKTNSFFNIKPGSIYLSEKEIIEIFQQYYKKASLITIKPIPEDNKIDMSENNCTNNVSIYIQKHDTKLQVITVLDNLGKGSAGAVIQNLKLMLEIA